MWNPYASERMSEYNSGLKNLTGKLEKEQSDKFKPGIVFNNGVQNVKNGTAEGFKTSIPILDSVAGALPKGGTMEDGIVDGISSGLAMLGPWGMAASAALKGLNMGMKETMKVDKAESFDSVMSNSEMAGTASQTIDVNDSIDKHNAKGISKLFGGKKKQKDLAGQSSEITRQQNTAAGFIEDGARQNKYASLGANRLASNTSNALSGMQQMNQRVSFLREGGVIGIDKNLIVGGKLHAHKNDLVKAEKMIANKRVTGKGTPVMLVKNGETKRQHMEIEKGELVLRAEVMEEIEDLRKDGSKESKIKAGLLLAKELTANTKDLSNEDIIKKAKDGIEIKQ